MVNPEERESILTIPNKAKVLAGSLLAAAALGGNLAACGEGDGSQSATNGSSIEQANPKGGDHDADQTAAPDETGEPFSGVTQLTVEGLGVDYSHTEKYGSIDFNIYGDSSLLPESTISDNLDLFSKIEFPFAAIPEDQRTYAELFLEGLNYLGQQHTNRTNVDVILEPDPDKCLIDPLGANGPIIGRQDEPGSGSCDDAFGFTYEFGSDEIRRYMMVLHHVDPNTTHQRTIGNNVYSLPGSELVKSTARHEMGHLLIRFGKFMRGFPLKGAVSPHGERSEEMFMEIFEENLLNLQR